MGRARWLLPVSLTVLAACMSPSFSVAGQNEPLEAGLRTLEEQVGQVHLSLPGENLKGREAAEDLARFYQSDAFQGRIQEERQRLAVEIFGQKKAGQAEATLGKGENAASEERFYLFVSSSMPMATLRNYAADLVRLNDPRFVLVLRGFVGGAKRIGPTAAFVADVLKVDPDCDLGSTECPMRDTPFIVDPLLFHRTSINQVPALVYIPDVNGGEPLVVYGDSSIGYALELMARETGNKGLGHFAERLAPIP